LKTIVIEYVTEKVKGEIQVRLCAEKFDEFYGETLEEALNKARNYMAAERNINESQIEFRKRSMC